MKLLYKIFIDWRNYEQYNNFFWRYRLHRTLDNRIYCPETHRINQMVMALGVKPNMDRIRNTPNCDYLNCSPFHIEKLILKNLYRKKMQNCEQVIHKTGGVQKKSPYPPRTL